MADSRGGVSVVVSATDRASKTIDGINRKLDAMQRPTRQLQRQLTRFGELSGLTKLGTGFQNLARAGLRSFEAIAKIAAPLGAITGALSVAGLGRLITAFSDFGSQLGFTSRRIGVMPAQLQAMQGGAELAGTSAQALATGMGALGQTLVDVVAGRNTDAALMMTTLGISMRDATGHARKATDVLPELQNKIAAIKDPFLQARAAAAFFGGAADDMLPVLRMNSLEFARLTAQAGSYGTMSEEAIRKANDFRMAQVALSLSVRGLTNDIGEKLAPVLGPLLLQLADFIKIQTQDPHSRLNRMLDDLARFIKGVNWKNTTSDIQHMAISVDNLAQSFGGWKTILEGIIALKFGGVLLSLVGGLNPVTAAVLALTAAYIANGSAYDDFIQRRKKGKEADRESVALQEKFNALPPAKQIEFNAEQARNGLPQLTPGAARPPMPLSDLDRQRRAAGLPTQIGGARSSGGDAPAGDGLDAKARAVMGMLIAQGRDPATAAAMAANMARESGFNPGAIGDGGAAVGIGQWHPDRQKRIAEHFGKSLQNMNLQEQVAAYDWELRKFGPNLVPQAGAAQNGMIISEDFERPKDMLGESSKRAILASHFASLTPPVNIAGGSGSSAPVAQAATVKGSANVNINMRGAPPGTQVVSSTEGDLFSGAPRVNLAMAGVGP